MTATVTELDQTVRTFYEGRGDPVSFIWCDCNVGVAGLTWATSTAKSGSNDIEPS